METFNLQVFIKVLEHRGLSAVANELSMTVAGVSMLVDRLERHYRVQLVARQGRATVPTTAGEVLSEYARRVIEAERQLERDLDFAREIDRGWVRIGATRPLAERFLPPILSAFKVNHPDVFVRIEAGRAEVVRTLLLNRRVDFACMLAQEHEGLANTPLHRERILIVTEPNDPLAHRPVVSGEEILRRPFVIAGRNTGLHRRVELENALGGASLIVALEVADEEALKEAVARGLGCGLLPETLVERELRQGLLGTITVEGVSLAEDICLVRRKQSVLSEGATAACAAILNSRDPDLLVSADGRASKSV